MQDQAVAILAQNPSPQDRKIRLRWLVALSTIPLLGMAVAFGIAPATDPRPVELKTVIENLVLPQAAILNEGDSAFWREARIQRGDTIASLLNRLQVDDVAAVNFMRSAKNAKTLYQLVPGRSVRAQTSEDGELIKRLCVFCTSNKVNGGFVFHLQPVEQARDGVAALNARFAPKSTVAFI